MTLALEDGLDRLRGRTDPELPPKRLSGFVGGGDFRAGGELQARFVADLVGVEPGDRVLEVGSGIGRLALPLTNMISEQGSYDGLEIVPHGVRWCRRHITPGHPNFRFHHADVANRTYNRNGRIPAERYVFPFAPASFDLVILLSVFTHMMPAAMAHYLEEIGRVLAPEGRLLATFFLLNDESSRLLDAGRGLPLPHTVGEARVANPVNPEGAVALPETLVRDLLDRTGLLPVTIHYGSWCGRDRHVGYQDAVIATKP
ncbi:MAG TPA: class I SAM-dependent methyltransferase [Gaiellaceae bacterium]|nr:class I SAM-dependent methyltransferase [Gaiellaceae bacterium]